MTKNTLIKIVCFFIAITLLITACSKNNNGNNSDNNKTESKEALELSVYAGVDDLGRVLPLAGDNGVPAYDSNKYVGIFYFVWHGARQVPGPYDVSKIIEKDKDAARSDEAWQAAGGGPVGTNHWWGEPLFGYFRNTDRWVMSKDVQMLTDAGVDFIIFDYSNGNSYTQAVLTMLEILDIFHKQGFNVPKVSFVTKAESVRHMKEIYNDIYKSHPEYEHLWFKLDGKPLMIGSNKSPDLDQEVKDFFTIKYAQWPRESYSDDGFPWMDFQRPQTLYGKESGTTIMSVSVAQHSGTLALSSSAFYGDDTNKTRSYHNGANDKSEDAYLYGYNFAEQFEYAISQNPDIIFVTGWNEWIATRQNPGSWKYIDGTPNYEPVILVDAADINNSRDIQPMQGGFGDNYYMQLISYIRKFKGLAPYNTNLPEKSTTYGTIDFSNGFADWDKLGQTYIDYTQDTEHRDARGYGRIVYKNDTGRNDIFVSKVACDNKNIYFYVETLDPLTPKEDKHWMNLFISTGNEGNKTWHGYDFVVNRVSPSDNKAVLEKCFGGWNFEKVQDIDFMYNNNKLQIAIPLETLGYESHENLRIEFKWADNYVLNENNEADIFTFYTDGDAAPYGRLNYIFKNN